MYMTTKILKQTFDLAVKGQGRIKLRYFLSEYNQEMPRSHIADQPTAP